MLKSIYKIIWRGWWIGLKGFYYFFFYVIDVEKVVKDLLE